MNQKQTEVTLLGMALVIVSLIIWLGVLTHRIAPIREQLDVAQAQKSIEDIKTDLVKRYPHLAQQQQAPQPAQPTATPSPATPTPTPSPTVTPTPTASPQPASP